MDPHDLRRGWTPLKITSLYFLVGVLWIILSELGFNYLIEETKKELYFQMIKGIFFITITSAILYLGLLYFFKRNERYLRERSELLVKNHQLSTIINQGKGSVLILDNDPPNFRIADMNQGLLNLTGYSREELLGKSCSIFQGENTDPEAARKSYETLANGKTTTLEILNYRKDGSSFWNEVMYYPVFDDHRKILYFIILVNDVTERKQAEQRLIESQQRYKTLFEHNPEFICAINPEGIITSANPAVEDITGYKIHEVLHQDYQTFVADTDREKAAQYFYNAVEQGTERVNLKIIHKDGENKDLEVIGLPIVVEDKLEGIYVITKDITEIQNAEEMLRQAEKLNVVGELAAGIAHEIRNPLTSLKGFVQLLRPSLENKKAHTYTDVMESELDRIGQIVTELLLLAKPQSTVFKNKDLRNLLDHVLTLMNTKAIMSNVEIVMNYRSQVSSIYCEGNQLKQVIINLLKNAIEAMPSGGKIKMETEDSDDQYVLIRVIDQGGGIPEESLPKLGKPFYTTKEQGTGLGLMISSKIIREHGGEIEFKSHEGEGTTVEMTLPISMESMKGGSKYQTTS